VDVGRSVHHRGARGGGARGNRIQVLGPEPEVVDADLVQVLRDTLGGGRKLLVEHHERRVRVVAPAQIHAAAPRRRIATEVLDAVEVDGEADHVAVEGQRTVHVAYADSHVGQVANGHRGSVPARGSRRMSATPRAAPLGRDNLVLCAYTIPDATFEERVQAAADAGFSAI